ncbi:hypothetical protein [Cryptosporangium sp. NPDC048952]|uniref:hypothetical protein n=1 Tax=Cryptosporangium sp. NPDC048952 TaxID=3363961 RepID=UPI003710228D
MAPAPVLPGLVALGALALGALALGALALGALALGALALGALALDSIALGSVTLGAWALGAVALGAVALGAWALDSVALGAWVPRSDVSGMAPALAISGSAGEPAEIAVPGSVETDSGVSTRSRRALEPAAREGNRRRTDSRDGSIAANRSPNGRAGTREGASGPGSSGPGGGTRRSSLDFTRARVRATNASNVGTGSAIVIGCGTEPIGKVPARSSSAVSSAGGEASNTRPYSSTSPNRTSTDSVSGQCDRPSRADSSSPSAEAAHEPTPSHDPPAPSSTSIGVNPTVVASPTDTPDAAAVGADAADACAVTGALVGVGAADDGPAAARSAAVGADEAGTAGLGADTTDADAAGAGSSGASGASGGVFAAA